MNESENGNKLGGGFTPLEIQSGFAAKCGKIKKKKEKLRSRAFAQLKKRIQESLQ